MPMSWPPVLLPATTSVRLCLIAWAQKIIFSPAAKPTHWLIPLAPLLVLCAAEVRMSTQCTHTHTHARTHARTHAHTHTLYLCTFLLTTGPSIGTIRLVAGTSAQRGRVQLLTSSSEWQNLYTESSDWTSLVADLVCRQLGFQSGLRGFSSDYDASVDTGPSRYRISNLNCPASAVQFFANCTFDVTPTPGDSPAVVQCSSNGTYVWWDVSSCHI